MGFQGPRRPAFFSYPFLTGFGWVIGLVFLIPVAYLVVRGIDFADSFFDVLGSSRTLSALRKSIFLAISVTLSSAIIGVALAWVTSRTNIYGRKALTVLAPLPLVFPSYVGAVALTLGFSKGGLVEELSSYVGIESLPSINGFLGAWIALTLFTYPYVYLPTRAFFSNMPRAQEESAQLLGKGRGHIFFSIILPQSIRAISSGGLLVFLYTISDFGAVSLLRYNTLTVSIFSNRLANQAASITQAILLTALGLLVVGGERIFVRGRQNRMVPGTNQMTQAKAGLLKLGRGRGAWSWLVWIFLFFSLVGPVVVMIFWIVRGVANRGRTSGSLAIQLDGIWEPLLNTIYLGLLAGIITVIVVFPIARLSVRHKSKVGSVSGSIISSNFGLPGLIVALSLVYWTLNGPGSSFLSGWLYQTLPLMIGAYIIHFGAQALGSTETALAGVSQRMEEASRILGAGRLRRFYSVELPLMLPVLTTGMVLVMISTMKELPITLLLAPPNFSTLSTDIWGAIEERAFAQAGLMSLILIGVSGTLSWLVIFRSSKLLDRVTF